MVHHIRLVKLKPGATTAQVEEMMIETRMRLLKIPEVRNLQCGKKIAVHDTPFDFFISIDLESLAKLKVMEESAIFLQFSQQVLEPRVAESKVLCFEMEPGKDTRYS